MKVLLVVRWPVGGIRMYIRYIYSQDVFANDEFTIIAPDLEFSEYLKTFFPERRLRFVAAKNSDKSLMKTVRAQLRNDRFDLIHSHGYSAAISTLWAKPFESTPHIMTAHDMFLERSFSGLKGSAKKMGIRWLFSSVKKILSVSEDAKRNMLENFPNISATKIKNITNGIDTRLFKNPDPRDFRKELNISHDRYIIGFFGRFMAPKGFRQLVNAIASLKNMPGLPKIPLVITFGWGGFIREDYEEIERQGLSSYFIQVPQTDDMPAAIKGVDLVVMPSRWETCPLLPMEVLTVGKPIIGTNCIGLREVLSGTPARMVDVGNAEQLASAIAAQMSRGEDEFLRYREAAKSRFSAKKHAEELYKTYQQITVDGTPN